MTIAVTPVHDPLTGSKVDIEGTYDGARKPPPISFHVFSKLAAGLVGLVQGGTDAERQPPGFKVRIDRGNASLPKDDKALSDPSNYVVYWDFATEPKWEPGPLPNTPAPPPRPDPFGDPWWVHLIAPAIRLFFLITLPVWALIVLAGLSVRAFRAIRRLFKRLFFS